MSKRGTVRKHAEHLGLGAPRPPHSRREIAQRLRTELAVTLYTQGALSLGKAAELAEMNRCSSARSWDSGEFHATRSWRKKPRMLVTSNTSPISNLAIIGRLNLLRLQFREIWMPGAVRAELDQLSQATALTEIQQSFQEG